MLLCLVLKSDRPTYSPASLPSLSTACCELWYKYRDPDWSYGLTRFCSHSQLGSPCRYARILRTIILMKRQEAACSCWSLFAACSVLWHSNDMDWCGFAILRYATFGYTDLSTGLRDLVTDDLGPRIDLRHAWLQYCIIRGVLYVILYCIISSLIYLVWFCC